MSDYSGLNRVVSTSFLSTTQPSYSLLPASAASASYASISPTTTTPSTNVLYDRTASDPSLLRIVPFISVTNATSIGMRVVGWNPCPFPSSYTNIATYSQDVTNAAWIKANVTPAIGIVNAPDGTSTTNRLFETTDNAGHFAAKQPTAPTVDTEIRTFSVYVKGGLTRQFAVISNGNESSNSFYAVTIDLSSGDITNSELCRTGAGTYSADWFDSYTPTCVVTNAGGSWWRVAITCRATVYHLVYPSNTPTPTAANGFGGPNYAGNTSMGIYVWGAQIEFGTTANPYLATTASAVTGTIAGAFTNVWIPTVLADLTLVQSTGTKDTITAGSYVFSNITQVALSPDVSLYRPAAVEAGKTETASVLVDTVGSQLVQVQFKATVASGSVSMGAAWYSI